MSDKRINKMEIYKKNVDWSVATFVLVAVIIIGIFLIRNKEVFEKVNLDAFASCLADKKVIMYGASSCSHCQAEKNRFGDSFKFVQYVECPENVKLCVEKGIEGYPTWILGDGQKFFGEQGLLNLSELSACPLPEVYYK